MTVPSTVPVFGDRYVVEKEIGSDGIVAVYEGVDRRQHRRVIITVLTPRTGDEKAVSSEHYRATAGMLGLVHPNILALYESALVDQQYYFVSEFVEGRTLAEMLDAGEWPAERDALKYAAQADGAIAYARAKGIQLDVRLKSICITPGGIVKIPPALDADLAQSDPIDGFASGDELIAVLHSARSETQLYPMRSDASGTDAMAFMMDAIERHFSGTSVLPIRDDPAPRRWPLRAIAGGSLLVLLVAAGIAYVTTQYAAIPDFSGMTQAQARETLLGDGFLVTISRQKSALVRDQHVIEQQPSAGRWMKKGSDVLLVVSDGEPAPLAAVPSPRVVRRSIQEHPRTAAHPVASTGHKAPRISPTARPAVAKPLCSAGDLVDIRGYPRGCKALSIASSGTLRDGMGTGLTVPVTSLNDPGKVSYALAYVTPISGFRRFAGVLSGNGHGDLIARVQNGMFVEQNGSRVRYSTFDGSRIVAVQAAAPGNTPSPEATSAAGASKCHHTTWLRRTLHKLFDAEPQACP